MFIYVVQSNTLLYFSLKKSYPGAKIYWCSVVITDWKIETRMSLQDFAFSYDFLTFIIISLMCVLSTLEEFFLIQLQRPEWFRKSFLDIQNCLYLPQRHVRWPTTNLDKFEKIDFSSQFEPNLILELTMSFCTLSTMLLRSRNSQNGSKIPSQKLKMTQTCLRDMLDDPTTNFEKLKKIDFSTQILLIFVHF